MKACVVISTSNFELAKSSIAKFEMAEVRLDLCQFSPVQIIELFSSNKNLIATYRHNEFDIEKKLEVLKLAIESGASCVDIEFELDLKKQTELIRFAKKHNTKIIISYHSFELTKSLDELKNILKISKLKAADIIKIAVKIESKNDEEALMSLYKKEKNLIAFGLGEKAKHTRIESLKLGAPYAYVYDGDKINQIADGLLSFEEFMLEFG